MTGFGDEFRQSFLSMIETEGQTIMIHLNMNSPQATSFEVRGLKNTVSKHSSQVIFQFADALDIPVGAVLQVKGSRDYWKVTDTEDIIEDGTFLNFDVYVQKVNIAGQPTKQPTHGAVFNLHGMHSRVNIQSQDSSINVSRQSTETVFADMRQAIQSQIANARERDEILHRLKELEAAKGTTSFTVKYQAFVASAANHMTLLAPFIGPLTKMLTS